MNRSIVAALFFWVSLSLRAQTTAVPQAQVKAVFLFNFARFVDWPPNSFANANGQFVIGILGENPFGPYLEESIQNESKDGHPIVLKYFSNADEVKNCNILFINKQGPEQLGQIFKVLEGQKILTVGDASEFAKRGGMIRFITEDNKVRFQVNVDAVKEANLSISSKMLRLAEIINSPKP